jgi:hypothetical protein
MTVTIVNQTQDLGIINAKEVDENFMMQVTIINHSNSSADLSRTQIKEEIDEFNDENLIKINPKANISDQMPYWNLLHHFLTIVGQQNRSTHINLCTDEGSVSHR